MACIREETNTKFRVSLPELAFPNPQLSGVEESAPGRGRPGRYRAWGGASRPRLFRGAPETKGHRGGGKAGTGKQGSGKRNGTRRLSLIGRLLTLCLRVGHGACTGRRRRKHRSDSAPASALSPGLEGRPVCTSQSRVLVPATSDRLDFSCVF